MHTRIAARHRPYPRFTDTDRSGGKPASADGWAEGDVIDRKSDAMRAGRWLPHDCPMDEDIAAWNDAARIPPDARHRLLCSLGMLSAATGPFAKQVLLGIYRQTETREHRQIILHAAFESSIHTQACQYITDALGLHQSDVLDAYFRIPGAAAYELFLAPSTSTLTDPGFCSGAVQGKSKYLRSMIVHVCLADGLMLHACAAQLRMMARRYGMPGIDRQVRHILCDLARRCAFGIELVQSVAALLPPDEHDFMAEMPATFQQAVALQIQYAAQTMPDDGEHDDAARFPDFLRHVADLHARQIGLPALFPDARNPYPWMDEFLPQAIQRQ